MINNIGLTSRVEDFTNKHIKHIVPVLFVFNIILFGISGVISGRNVATAIQSGRNVAPAIQSGTRSTIQIVILIALLTLFYCGGIVMISTCAIIMRRMRLETRAKKLREEIDNIDEYIDKLQNMLYGDYSEEELENLLSLIKEEESANGN